LLYRTKIQDTPSNCCDAARKAAPHPYRLVSSKAFDRPAPSDSLPHRRRGIKQVMSGISLLPPDSDRPTLKTIAAETGLAIATVSRALKDASDISEDTKKRVRETAERLGYRPNRAGVRLRTGKTNVIALVLSTEADVMNHTSKLIYSIA